MFSRFFHRICNCSAFGYDKKFRDLLKAEDIKNRYNNKQPTLLTHQLKTAAKELRNHSNITIKKADKTNIFLVLNKTDYHSKLQNILDDHTKFKN